MKNLSVFFLSLLLAQLGFSQELEADIRLRPRAEYRNGFKTLLKDNQNAASLISQRTRLKLNYRQEKLDVVMSLQNIRVWGDSPQLNSQDRNGIALFEGYAVYKPSEWLNFKLGRQVLAYDNQRILGEVDWAQQGQSHDALVIKLHPGEGQQLDLGFALNNEEETLTEVPYRLASYKNLQYAWYHLDFSRAGLSFLFLNNGYEFQTQQELWKTDYRQTFGTFYRFDGIQWAGDAGIYGQTGEYLGKDLQAFYAGMNLRYHITETWTFGVGGEYLSGTGDDSDSSVNKSFTPLFGTNHAFNGFMDYFFVGSHQNSVGLVDLYARLSYNQTRWNFAMIPHIFHSAADIVDPVGVLYDNYLGTELDVIANFKVSQAVSLHAGYSQMFGSESLTLLKGGDHLRVQNFAWLSVSIHPRLFSVSN